MAEINVSAAEINRYRKLISESKLSVNTLINRMILKLRNAQNTWDDKNYRKLEEISVECVEELKMVYEVLLDAEKYLDSVYAIVSEYENTGFSQVDTASNRETFLLSFRTNGTRKEERKKMNILKDGLSGIDTVLQEYKKELLARGLTDGAAMSAILNHYRHQFQAELLGRVNGENFPPRSAPNFDALVESVQRDGLDQYHEISATPRNLSQTRYGFQDIVFNGQRMNVYNDPIGTGSLLIQEQGKSQYPMAGTCGLCQSANILTMAGVTTTEDDIISIALHSSDDVLECMELFDEESDERGGTTVRNRQEILESQGISIINLPISSDRNRTVRQLAGAVASGHGVILSVDVERLWRNGQSGGHAISLLSVTSDGSTFIYSDTGYGRIDTISAEDLAAALTGRPANITTNIIR